MSERSGFQKCSRLSKQRTGVPENSATYSDSASHQNHQYNSSKSHCHFTLLRSALHSPALRVSHHSPLPHQFPRSIRHPPINKSINQLIRPFKSTLTIRRLGHSSKSEPPPSPVPASLPRRPDQGRHEANHVTTTSTQSPSVHIARTPALIFSSVLSAPASQHLLLLHALRSCTTQARQSPSAHLRVKPLQQPSARFQSGETQPVTILHYHS